MLEESSKGQFISEDDPSPALQGSSKSGEYISHVGKGEDKSEDGVLLVPVPKGQAKPGFLKKMMNRVKGEKGIIISISNLFQVD